MHRFSASNLCGLVLDGKTEFYLLSRTSIIRDNGSGLAADLSVFMAQRAQDMSLSYRIERLYRN